MMSETLSGPMEHRFSFPLVGGTIELSLYGIDALSAESIAQEAKREGLRLQKIFNLYDPQSELSSINARRVAKVSSEMEFVLKEALRLCQETDGQYDITKGKSFLARKSGEEVTVLCSHHDVTLDGGVVRFTHPDVHIDLGSIAKGYIVDRLGALIRSHGVLGGFIDARGDLLAFGPSTEIVDIEHPRDSGGVAGSVVLQEAAIATSGDYAQYVDDYERSHLLGRKDIISASVLAPTLMQADAIATALALVGMDKAKALLAKHPECSAVLIDETGQTTIIEGLLKVEVL